MPTFPHLITIHDYLRPLNATEYVLQNVKSKVIAGDSDQLNLQGHFLLVYCSFEAMLNGLLTAHLLEHPDRLKGEVEIRRELITDNYTVRTLLADLVERRVDAISRERPAKFFELFCGILTIRQFMNEDDLGKFERLKNERNILVHRGLAMDGSYLDRSGYSAQDPFGRHSVANAHLIEVVDWLLRLTCAMREGLIERFGDLTRIQVLRNVWDFMLGRNVLVKFDDVWRVDEQEDGIVGYVGEDGIEDNFSHSEKILFQAWRAQFHKVGVELTMRTLSGTTAQKLFWFLEATQRMWVH